MVSEIVLETEDETKPRPVRMGSNSNFGSRAPPAMQAKDCARCSAAT